MLEDDDPSFNHPPIPTATAPTSFAVSPANTAPAAPALTAGIVGIDPTVMRTADITSIVFGYSERKYVNASSACVTFSSQIGTWLVVVLAKFSVGQVCADEQRKWNVRFSAGCQLLTPTFLNKDSTPSPPALLGPPSLGGGGGGVGVTRRALGIEDAFFFTVRNRKGYFTDGGSGEAGMFSTASEVETLPTIHHIPEAILPILKPWVSLDFNSPIE